MTTYSQSIYDASVELAELLSESDYVKFKERKSSHVEKISAMYLVNKESISRDITRAIVIIIWPESLNVRKQ